MHGSHHQQQHISHSGLQVKAACRQQRSLSWKTIIVSKHAEMCDLALYPTMLLLLQSPLSSEQTVWLTLTPDAAYRF